MQALNWFERLGPMGYPLLLCSVLSISLIGERVIFYLRAFGLGRERAPADEAVGLPASVTMPATGKGPLATAVRLLLANRKLPREQRDELMSHWLDGHRRSLLANLGWLTLLAVASPMLGLLGTVLGMLEAFRELAAHSGPVTPSLLANGIWQALLTTAAGLAIALPALVAAHAFRIWVDGHLQTLAHHLNTLTFALDGLVVAPLATPNPSIEPAVREDAA